MWSKQAWGCFSVKWVSWIQWRALIKCVRLCLYVFALHVTKKKKKTDIGFVSVLLSHFRSVRQYIGLLPVVDPLKSSLWNLLQSINLTHVLGGKQRGGNRIGSQLSKLNVRGMAVRSVLVPEVTEKVHTANRWRFVLWVPTDPNKCLCSCFKSFDQRRVSARERLLR